MINIEIAINITNEMLMVAKEAQNLNLEGMLNAYAYVVSIL